MGLVEKPRADTGPKIRLLPTLLASLVSVVTFVVVIAVVARATADGAAMPVREIVDAGFVDAGFVDAGFVDGCTGGSVDGGSVDGGSVDGGSVDVGSVDAGIADAGPLVTVSIDAGPISDGGPADVEGPPYDVAGVATVAAVLVEVCAKDGLRWDPSLGGPFLLRVTLPEAGASTTSAIIEADGLRSPVLASCLKRRSPLVVLPPGAVDLLVPQQVVARASLATDGRINILGVDVVALP